MQKPQTDHSPTATPTGKVNKPQYVCKANKHGDNNARTYSAMPYQTKQQGIDKDEI